MTYFPRARAPDRNFNGARLGVRLLEERGEPVQSAATGEIAPNRALVVRRGLNPRALCSPVMELRSGRVTQAHEEVEEEEARVIPVA